MTPRLKRTGDEGFALATVMGAVAVISVIALTGFFLAENTLNESLRVFKENRAYQAASSGLEFQFQDFDQARFDAGLGSKTGYAYGSWLVINGTDRYRVDVRSMGSNEYEMVSVGESEVTSETVKIRFLNLNLWDMQVSGSEGSPIGSGAGFNGNGRIIGPVYSSGDFNWSGNGSLEMGPIFVRNGVFDKESSGSIVGSENDLVAAYFDNPPTGHATGMYIEDKGSAPKLVVPWPTEARMGEWKQMALADAASNKLGNDGLGYVRHAGSESDANYNIFNGDVTLGGPNSGKPGYIARYPDQTVNELDSGDVFAVDGSTLWINGVVYCDGTLTVSNSITTYRGRGLLVARNLVIENRLAPPTTDTETLYLGMPEMTANDCMGLCALNGITMQGTGWVSAAVYTGGAFSAPSTGASFRGSIIGQGIDFGQPNALLVTQPGLGEIVPPGMPDLSVLKARSDWIRE